MNKAKPNSKRDKMHTGEEIKNFEDHPDFKRELAIAELLKKGDFKKADKLIGDDPVIARQTFQSYQALKALDAISHIESITTYTKTDTVTSPVLDTNEKTGFNKSFREIVITAFNEGITTGLRLLSGEEFLNTQLVGATRKVDKNKTVGNNPTEIYLDGNFYFSKFNIGKIKNPSPKSEKVENAEDNISVIYKLTVPNAQTVQVVVLPTAQKPEDNPRQIQHNAKDQEQKKVIYQGKRVKYLELPLARGRYEVSIDDEQWFFVLA